MAYDEDYRDVGVLIAQFTLTPDIPEREKEYYEDFCVMFSKIAPMSNIERRDQYKYKILFKLVTMLLNNGYYRTAHEYMGEYLMELQLSRGVDALQTLYGQRGITSYELLERGLKSRSKRGFRDRLKGAFSRKKEIDEGIVEE